MEKVIHYFKSADSGVPLCGDEQTVSIPTITKYLAKVTCEDCSKAIINPAKYFSAKKVTFVCSHCKSEDVIADTHAEWSVEKQEWVVTSIFDKGAYCNKCDSETRLDEKEI